MHGSLVAIAWQSPVRGRRSAHVGTPGPGPGPVPVPVPVGPVGHRTRTLTLVVLTHSALTYEMAPLAKWHASHTLQVRGVYWKRRFRLVSAGPAVDGRHACATCKSSIFPLAHTFAALHPSSLQLAPDQMETSSSVGGSEANSNWNRIFAGIRSPTATACQRTLACRLGGAFPVLRCARLAHRADEGDGRLPHPRDSTSRTQPSTGKAPPSRHDIVESQTAAAGLRVESM